MDDNNKNGDNISALGQGELLEEFVTVDKYEVLAGQQEDLQPTVLPHAAVAEAPDISDAKIDSSEQKCPTSSNEYACGTMEKSETLDAAAGFPAENTACDLADGGLEGCKGEFVERAGGFEDTPSESWEEVRSKLVVLQCDSTAPGGICEVYLVGTAHVSQESCREVQAVIHHLKPQVVFLELCSSRVGMLAPQELEVPSFGEMIDMWRNKKMNAMGLLYSWFLAKIADKLEVFPGSEFRIAYVEAMAYGAKVVLGDRPVQITLRRTWAKMSWWYKAKFLFSIVFQAMWLPSAEELNKMMEELGDVDMLTLMIQEMSKTFPSLIETLVHERDMYMSSTLLNVASENNSVVAVVGRGHLSGIKKNWKQPVSVGSLLEVPDVRSSSGKLWTALALAAGGVAIFSGIYLLGRK